MATSAPTTVPSPYSRTDITIIVADQMVDMKITTDSFINLFIVNYIEHGTWNMVLLLNIQEIELNVECQRNSAKKVLLVVY